MADKIYRDEFLEPAPLRNILRQPELLSLEEGTVTSSLSCLCHPHPRTICALLQ